MTLNKTNLVLVAIHTIYNFYILLKVSFNTQSIELKVEDEGLTLKSVNRVKDLWSKKKEKRKNCIGK